MQPTHCVNFACLLCLPHSIESAREVTVALEVDALGAADGTVRGIDVDVEVRTWA